MKDHSLARVTVLAIVFLILSLGTGAALADGPVANVGLRASAYSNVFFDKSEQWDLALSPSADLGYDFARIWSVGYAGELNGYIQNPELLSHRHELYLFANPAWGTESENELVVELSADTLRNQQEFSALNVVRPSLLASLEMEPLYWFRWQVSTRLSYRLFYDDRPSDSVDAWTTGRVSFALPSRTSISPGLSFGYRYYPRQIQSLTNDDSDQQIEAGVRLGQGLWEKAGLQAEYSYLHAMDESGLLLRKVTEAQFAFLEQDFLFSGHQGSIGLKQILGDATTLQARLAARERLYAGWVAVDANGLALNEDRRDLLLTPSIYLGQVLVGAVEEETDLDLGIDLEYAFTRQWSNSDWYDTSAHVGSLSLWGSF